MANTALEARERYVRSVVAQSITEERTGWEDVDPSLHPNADTIVDPELVSRPLLRETIGGVVTEIFTASRYELNARVRRLSQVTGEDEQARLAGPMPLVALRSALANRTTGVILKRHFGGGELFSRTQALTHNLIRDVSTAR